jgi:hypothetical protein
MTFDDDFIRIEGSNFYAVDLGLQWPPPERLTFRDGGFREATDSDSPVWIRHRMSAITDEERSKMTHVCRGAEYFDEANEPRCDIDHG